MTVSFPPSPSLRSFISRITVHLEDGAGSEGTFERVLPTGDLGIVINLRRDEFRTYDGSAVTRASGAILAGPHTKPRVINTKEIGSMVSVGFKPGGAVAFIGDISEEIADTMVDLAAFSLKDDKRTTVGKVGTDH